MNWVREAPDEDQRREHDDLVRIVDPFVERHPFSNRYCDHTLDGRMPVDASDRSILAELQISE